MRPSGHAVVSAGRKGIYVEPLDAGSAERLSKVSTPSSSRHARCSGTRFGHGGGVCHSSPTRLFAEVCVNRQKRAYVSGAILALGGLTAGCDPGTPASTPSPSASSAISPTVAATPPETEQEKQQRAFDSAEDSYRSFIREFDALSNRGYTGPPTSALNKWAAGPYLKLYAGFLRAGKGIRSDGTVRVVYVKHASFSGSELTLRSCEDASKVKNYDAKTGRLVSRGSVAIVILESRLINGHWKIWNSKDRRVESCDS